MYYMKRKRLHSFRLDEILISHARETSERNGLTLTDMVEEGLILLIQRYEGNELSRTDQSSLWMDFFEKNLIRVLGEVVARFDCKIVKSNDPTKIE